MVLDRALGRSAPVFGGGRGGQVPFDEAGAGNERDVVEVDDAECQFEAHPAGFADEGAGHCLVELVFALDSAFAVRVDDWFSCTACCMCSGW